MKTTLLSLALIIQLNNIFGFQDKDNSINLPQIGEKVYLHIDRTIFKSGEDIWFKAYIIDFLTNKPSENTNNLHVELISPESNILQQRIIRIQKGTGNGDFRLNDSLPSGKYLIRAYTNYMRNFGSDLFFTKEINIINPTEILEKEDSIRFIQDRLFIDFFPEGGSLVDDVNSIVAFKATNSIGNGINISGSIFTGSGDFVTTIESSNLGMGFFQHKPSAEEEFYLVAKNNNINSTRVDLPQSFPTGIVIHSVKLENKKLFLKLLTNEKSLQLYKNKEFRLEISIRNLFAKQTNLKVTSVINNFLIPLDNFPQGILKLTLFDPSGKPAAERLIFNFNDKEARLGISTDKDLYSLREPATLKLTLSGNESSKANLSLSVFDSKMSLDTSKYSSNIASWFLLESDIRGRIENPGIYFDVSNENRFEQMDLLLLTQGWRDFVWKYDTTKTFEHEIGFSVKGHVMIEFREKPFPFAKVNIAVFDEKKAIILTDDADSSGHFLFSKLDITGKAKILVSITNEKNKLTGRVYIDSSVYDPPTASILPEIKYELEPTQYNLIFEETREIELFKKKFKLSDTLQIGEVIVSARKIEKPIDMNLRSSRVYYGKPDKELILAPRHSNYSSISRILVGNVAGVEVNTTTHKVTIRGETPLILVDGIPGGGELAPGGATLPGIPPSMIDRIDILYWSSPFGSRGANGIINIITKRGDYNYDALVTPHSKYVIIKGFDEPRVFYSPKYDTKYFEGQTPDFRSTIHWQPNIELNSENLEKIIFYNPDKETTIIVKAEGITEDGIPLIGTLKYKIKR